MAVFKRLGIAVLGIAGLPVIGLAGWTVADVYSMPVVSAVSGPHPIVRIDHQSKTLQPALAMLSGKFVKAAPEQEAFEPFAEPAPISVERLLRGRLKAILGTGRGAILVLAPAGSETGPRRLKLGEDFHDGWILSKIGSQQVTLMRNGESVSVELFYPPSEGMGGPAIEGLTQAEIDSYDALSAQRQ